MEENNTTTQTEPVSKKKSPISLPAAILTAAVIIALGLVIAFGGNKAPNQGNAPVGAPKEVTEVPKDVAQIRSGDYVRGSKNADIVVIEYSDSDCPFCARFHPTMNQVVEESNGSVAWVYRFFPLDMHPNAYTEAVAMACVGSLGGNDAMWSYLDTVIDVTLNADPKSNETLVTLAGKTGVDATALKTCMTGEVAVARVDRDYDEAQNLGITGTPFSIVVNTKTGKQATIPGALPIEQVRGIIESVK